MRTNILILVASLAIAFTSCQKSDPEFNQVRTIENIDGLHTGRVLFYDKQLSVNNTTACSSCHRQQFAFADNVSLSTGFNNQRTLRNSPPIQNLRNDNEIFFPGFTTGNLLFWDGRESNLTEMMLQPMVNHREMGIYDLEALCDKLESIDYYQELFIRDYGDTSANLITPGRIAEQLSSFVSGITTFNKMDNTMFGMNLSPQEELGRQLFFNKYDCASCHHVTQFSGYLAQDTNAFANIGLDVVYEDKGLGAISHNAKDNGRFRIPSLKNIGLTAPYMHDGRFSTLSEVIDHYSHGIVNHQNLDNRLKNQFGSSAKFNITDHEKSALISFLNSFTDFNLITNPALSDPFVIKSK